RLRVSPPRLRLSRRWVENAAGDPHDATPSQLLAVATLVEKAQGLGGSIAHRLAQLDPAFPPSLAQRFADNLPRHAPIVRIDNASHYLQEDTPEPIETIRNFIREQRSAALGR
ncbi:MAG: alpha/beta fold hydrolase, partial [Candidatus Binatia bacterium]